jgi:aminocarboxymuconate-semialdehyde decarboxylase
VTTSNVAVTAVDVHSHAMPLALLRELEGRGLADLSGMGRQVLVLDPRVSGLPPGVPLPLARGQHDPAVRLADMDRTGLSHHAVSLPPLLFCTTMPDPGLTLDIVRRGNDELAEYVASGGGRLVGLGSVPVGLAEATGEAERCLEVLGMAGVAMGTSGAGRELDDPVNEDLYRFLGERQAFIFLHPSRVPAPERMGDYWLPQLVGYPAETALAVARLVFGGVLDRHPLILCLAHGGGCLPSLRGRLDLGWRRKEVAHTTSRLPSQLLDALYYDTAVFSAPQLRRLVEDVGTGRVVLGTDYPFDLADDDPLGTVRAVGLTAFDEEQVRSATAARLLGLGEKERRREQRRTESA